MFLLDLGPVGLWLESAAPTWEVGFGQSKDMTPWPEKKHSNQGFIVPKIILVGINTKINVSCFLGIPYF